MKDVPRRVSVLSRENGQCLLPLCSLGGRAGRFDNNIFLKNRPWRQTRQLLRGASAGYYHTPSPGYLA